MAAVLPEAHSVGDSHFGKNGFESTFRGIEPLRDLLLLPAGEAMYLPPMLFREFDGTAFTFDAFEEGGARLEEVRKVLPSANTPSTVLGQRA